MLEKNLQAVSTAAVRARGEAFVYERDAPLLTYVVGSFSTAGHSAFRPTHRHAEAIPTTTKKLLIFGLRRQPTKMQTFAVLVKRPM